MMFGSTTTNIDSSTSNSETSTAPTSSSWFSSLQQTVGTIPTTTSNFTSSIDETMNSLLPTFQIPNVDGMMNNIPNVNLDNFSYANMKGAMEQQMPKKILGMGYQQRFQVFCGLLVLAVLFFGMAFFVGLPMIGFRPQKFAISFTFGSLTFLASFGIMKGPVEHLTSLFQPDRFVFTSFYFVSMFMTLYFTFKWHGLSAYVAILVASGLQLVSLVWYLISFLPGGSAGLQYMIAVMFHLIRPFLVVCARWQAICLGRCISWMAGFRGGSSMSS